MSDKARRQQLETAAESMNAMATEIEVIGSEIQNLVKSASEVEGNIKTLTERLSTSGVSGSVAICLELTTAVRRRMELASAAQSLNMRSSQTANKLRDTARHVKPPRIIDTVGRKIFGDGQPSVHVRA